MPPNGASHGAHRVNAMAMRREGVMLAAVMVVLLTVAAVTTYAFAVLADDDDPIRATRCYTVEGMIDGALCSGTGEAEYRAENSNYPTYYFELELTCADGGVRTLSFGMIFEPDGTPYSLQYEYEGTDVYNGEGVTVWTFSEDGVSYTFLVSTDCTVVSFTASSDSISLTAVLVRRLVLSSEPSSVQNPCFRVKLPRICFSTYS